MDQASLQSWFQAADLAAAWNLDGNDGDDDNDCAESIMKKIQDKRALTKVGFCIQHANTSDHLVFLCEAFGLALGAEVLDHLQGKVLLLEESDSEARTFFSFTDGFA